jgi:RNA polymerase sigma factor (TIGR02999 family)
MPDAHITQALVSSRGDRRRSIASCRWSTTICGTWRRELRRERPDHTLTPTALVHEAYLKLVQLERIDWQGRAHFFGACAQVMRRVLISYARMKKAEKRGGGVQPVTLENVVAAAESRPAELLALDEALVRLEALSARQARIVECRFFAGMGVEETAAALGISPATVKREWTAARAWLNRELMA